MDLKAVWNNVKENGLSGTFHVFLKRHKLQKYYDNINRTIEDAKDKMRYLCYEFENNIYHIRNTEVVDSVKSGDRPAIINEFSELAANSGKEFGCRSTLDYYYDEPIEERTVLLTGLGKNVRGNLFYILNEMNSNPEFEGFKIYVYAQENAKSIMQKFIDQNHWIRTTAIYTKQQYDHYLFSAQFIIGEAQTSGAWIKQENQIYINTWHGTPLKKLGLAKKSDNIHHDGLTQCEFIRANYLLFPNEYTEQSILSSYKVADLMKGEIIKLGYPRTGGMLAEAQSDQTALMQQLAPNGEKLYAYMPTWKDYLQHEEVIAETTEFLDYMEEHLSDDQLLYVNLHHRVNDCINYDDYKRIKQFPQTVDNYQVLAMTEALITDYSSVFYDYLALRRQIILYCPDYEIYKEKRGTYMDLDELPFDRAETPAEVIDALNRGKTYDDSVAYQRFCPYDSTENARKLCGLLLGHRDDLDLESVPHSGKRQVLIYSHQFEESEDTERLKEYIKLNKNYQIYLGCEQSQIDNNIGNAYPIFHSVSVFGVQQNFHLSSAGKTALQMYLEEKISFEDAMRVLIFDYGVAYKRMFGGAQFDLVVIYDLTEPEMMVALALMQAKKKMFYLSDAEFEKLKEGDKFFQDAVQYALPHMDQVCVNTKEKLKLIRSLCTQPVLLQEKSTAEDLNYQISRLLNT